jgi:hypothetical protein
MPDKTWLNDVQHAIEALGGEASVKAICRVIQKQRTDLGPNWQAVIRATIYHNSSDSPAYDRSNPDVFKKISHGVWALRHPGSVIDGRSQLAISMATLNELVGPPEAARAALESPEKALDVLFKDTRQKIKSRFRLDQN